MHRSPPLLLRILLPLVSLLASSCVSQRAASAPINITEPRNGTAFPSNASVTLQVDLDGVGGTSGAWQMYDYQLVDNGVIVSQGANQPLSDASRTMLLPGLTNGTHVVMVRGRAGRPDPSFAEAPSNAHRIYSDWYTSNPLCIYVGPNPPEDFCASVPVAGALPLVTATASPFPTSAATRVPVIQAVSAFPPAVSYGKSCPSLSSVTFRAALSVPAGMAPAWITVQAHVSVEVGMGQSTSGSFLVPLHATGALDTATGGAVYTGTLALTHSYHDASGEFDPAALAGESGALVWYVDATSHDAAGQNAFYLGRTMDQVVDLSPCPLAAPSAQQSSTPGSGSDYPIQGCTQYTNELSCDLSGCAWTGSACAVSP